MPPKGPFTGPDAPVYFPPSPTYAIDLRRTALIRAAMMAEEARLRKMLEITGLEDVEETGKP